MVDQMNSLFSKHIVNSIPESEIPSVAYDYLQLDYTQVYHQEIIRQFFARKVKKTLFIRAWKVARALVRPKVITLNS